MNNEMDKMLIMDHYKFPHNKEKIEDTEYVHQHGFNPSCGDEIDLYIKFDGDTISDVKWVGNGCSICMASTSMMSDELIGLSVDEAIDKIENFKNMISGHDVNLAIFADAQALNGLDKFPSRFKCGYLAWGNFLDLLNNH